MHFNLLIPIGTFLSYPNYIYNTFTYLQPVGLSKADADTGSKGTSRHTAHHYRHALTTGIVALQLNLPAQFTIRQFRLVACAVDRKAPVVLLTTLGQQSEKE